MSNNKVLVVMGSPGSGKTTASVKLALELARSRRNAVIVFCDPFTPVIPYLTAVNTVIDTSLGMLLTSPGLTQKMILDACVPIPHNEYISLLGYKASESLMTYPKMTRDKTIEFFVMLRHLVDYVIIDCSAVFEADPVSIIGIEAADMVLRLGTSNLKGISYFQTHTPMMADSRFCSDRHLRAISILKPGQEWAAVSQQYGGAGYVLPYVSELEKQFDEISLFETLATKDGLAYTAEIQRILNGVFDVQTIAVKTPKTVAQKENGQPKVKMAFKLPFGKSKGEF